MPGVQNPTIGGSAPWTARNNVEQSRATLCPGRAKKYLRRTLASTRVLRFEFHYTTKGLPAAPDCCAIQWQLLWNYKQDESMPRSFRSVFSRSVLFRSIKDLLHCLSPLLVVRGSG